MLAFLERLGTSRLICWQPGKVLTLASKPRPLALRHWPLPAPMSLLPSLLGAPGLHLGDYLSMRRTALRGMQFGEEEVASLDTVAALDFFRDLGVSETMIDWWWRFAAMVVTNVPLERCSAASLLRIHAQLSGYTGLHFGFGAVGLGELYTAQATKVIEDAGGRVRCDRVVVADPVVLRPHDCGDRRRRDPPQGLVAVATGRLEVLQHPLVVTHLLADVVGDRAAAHVDLRELAR